MEARGKKWGVTRGARAVAMGAALWLAPSDAAAQAGKTGAAPAPAAAPSGPVIYPAKGQSPEKQQKDKTECYAWATEQTGYDPVAEAQAQVAQGQAAPAQSGGAVRGAAKGAAAGAAIGAVAGDAGKGAAVGATAGGVGGGARKKKQAAAQQQAASEQQAASAQRLAGYQKAFAACMEGRGYSVK